jgi:hypothetical protein
LKVNIVGKILSTQNLIERDPLTPKAQEVTNDIQPVKPKMVIKKTQISSKLERDETERQQTVEDLTPKQLRIQ